MTEHQLCRHEMEEDSGEACLTELLCAFDTLLSAAIEYVEYEHDGDPWAEDKRAMGEMELDGFRRSGQLEKFKLLLDKCRAEFIDERYGSKHY